MQFSNLIVLFSSLLISGSVFAAECTTPLECYEKAIEKLQLARAEVVASSQKSTEALQKAETANASATQAQQQVSAAINTANQAQAKANEAHNRLDGIRLTAESPTEKTFGCGQSGITNTNDATVMYGTLDGTGCGVQNRNYFKVLKLVVPRR